MTFLLTNISKFYQFENFYYKNTTFWKIDIKSNNKERPKTQEKTQNSRKKLRVWEALAPYVSPSGVKKMPDLSILNHFLIIYVERVKNPEYLQM